MRLLSAASSPVFAACLVVAAFLAVMEQGRAAAEGGYLVQLIWGTNGEKPKDKPLKDVDAKVREKLKGIFKWNNYYEVNRGSVAVSKEGSPKLKLSDKCEIELQDLGASRIEIRLFGEGRPVVKHGQKVIPGELIVLAGDSKDDTAWFVVLTPPK